MKYFLTCLALGIAFAAGAQTGLVEFPYNPDADNDDIIGVNDLLELLSLFGGEFAEENLYVNESETSAIYHIEGFWYYGMCAAKCRELPSGKWRIMEFDDWCQFHNEIESEFSAGGGSHAWLLESVEPTTSALATSTVYHPTVSVNNSDKGNLHLFPTTSGATCFCSTHERPKVEYSYCFGNDFEACTNEKVANGWYPLGSIMYDAFGWTEHNQAFWRWAE